MLYLSASVTTEKPTFIGPNTKAVLINMYKDDVLPLDNMVATRLSVTSTLDVSRYYGDLTKHPIIAQNADEYGSEICTQIFTYRYTATGSVEQLIAATNNYMSTAD